MKTNDYISDSGLATTGHSTGPALALAALVITPEFSIPAPGTSSPQVYNVVDYGTDPAGVIDSRDGVTQTIFAASTDGQPLGIIYFPGGKFKIARPVPAAPLTGKAVNLSESVNRKSLVNSIIV
jgi:hypothetical protein